MCCRPLFEIGYWNGAAVRPRPGPASRASACGPGPFPEALEQIVLFLTLGSLVAVTSIATIVLMNMKAPDIVYQAF